MAGDWAIVSREGFAGPATVGSVTFRYSNDAETHTIGLADSCNFAGGAGIDWDDDGFVFEELSIDDDDQVVVFGVEAAECPGDDLLEFLNPASGSVVVDLQDDGTTAVLSKGEHIIKLGR